MTRYTVVCVRGALDELTTFWLNAPDRNQITDAPQAIDCELARSPSTKGSTLHEGLCAFVQPPLRIVHHS